MLSKSLGSPRNINVIGLGIIYGTKKEKNTKSGRGMVVGGEDDESIFTKN